MHSRKGPGSQHIRGFVEKSARFTFVSAGVEQTVCEKSPGPRIETGVAEDSRALVE